MLQATRSVLLSLRGAANHVGIDVIHSTRPLASSACSQVRQTKPKRFRSHIQRSECGIKTSTTDQPRVRTSAAAVDLASVASVEAPDRQRRSQSEWSETRDDDPRHSPTMQVQRAITCSRQSDVLRYTCRRRCCCCCCFTGKRPTWLHPTIRGHSAVIPCEHTCLHVPRWVQQPSRARLPTCVRSLFMSVACVTARIEATYRLVNELRFALLYCQADQ